MHRTIFSHYKIPKWLLHSRPRIVFKFKIKDYFHQYVFFQCMAFYKVVVLLFFLSNSLKDKQLSRWNVSMSQFPLSTCPTNHTSTQSPDAHFSLATWLPWTHSATAWSWTEFCKSSLSGPHHLTYRNTGTSDQQPEEESYFRNF